MSDSIETGNRLSEFPGETLSRPKHDHNVITATLAELCTASRKAKHMILLGLFVARTGFEPPLPACESPV